MPRQNLPQVPIGTDTVDFKIAMGVASDKNPKSKRSRFLRALNGLDLGPGIGDRNIVVTADGSKCAGTRRTDRAPVEGAISGAAELITVYAITGATNATPIVITCDEAVIYQTGDTVVVASVGGNTAANGTWVVTRLSRTTFALNGSVGNGAYTSGGTASTPGSATFVHTNSEPDTMTRLWGVVGETRGLVEMRVNNGNGTTFTNGPINNIPTLFPQSGKQGQGILITNTTFGEATTNKSVTQGGASGVDDVY